MGMERDLFLIATHRKDTTFLLPVDYHATADDCDGSKEGLSKR